MLFFFFFSSRRRHTRLTCDWSSDVCSSDLAESVVPESLLVFPGETQQHADLRSISEMDTSKIDATYWVLSLLKGYPKDHGAGALVEAVGSGCPADGTLFPGDLIRSVNGHA